MSVLRRFGISGGTHGGHVGVVHQRGGAWSVVVAESRGIGRIIATELVELGDIAAVRSLLNKHGVGRVVRVFPVSGTVARTLELPAGDEDEVLKAAGLLAEAHLPAFIEPWRRGWGFSPLGDREGHRSVLQIGWVGDTGEGVIGLGEAEHWASEAVGLAWLASLGESGWALSVDREGGALGLAARGAGRMGGVIRTSRESASDEAGWSEAVDSLARECGVRIGEAVPGRGVVIESRCARALASAVEQSSVDAEWIDTFGVAAGIALAIVRGGSGGAGNGTLCEMSVERPERRVGVVERGASWLARPRHAWSVLAASLALLIICPLVFAIAREAVLSGKVARIEEGMGDTEELRLRAQLYEELGNRRWPMTKLLADVSNAMPVGVRVESVVINAGAEMSIRGKADSRQVLDEFVEKLNKSEVFSVRIGNRQRTDDGLEFEMTGRVIRPQAEARGLEDFSKRSLGVRLYGESYSEIEAAAEADEAEKEAERAERRRGSGGERIFDGGDSRREPVEAVPEALTDEQINALDRSQTLQEFGSRRKASNRRDIEDAERARLKDEVEKLRGRLRELKGGG